MPVAETFHTNDPETFKLKALYWADSFETACYFDSNNYEDPYSSFDLLLAAGTEKKISCHAGEAFQKLEDFLSGATGFIPGYFAYDLKNELEDLQSNHTDHADFPDLCFFIPQNTILLKGQTVIIHNAEAGKIWKTINEYPLPATGNRQPNITIRTRFSKAEYKDTVERIKDHIKRGDIYEMNFCQEFYAENASIEPVEAYITLNKISPTPFSVYYKTSGRYIISASPERFLCRRGSKLISQPIKGTSPRNPDRQRDEDHKLSLQNNEKERAENVMIVDLVRNDLTKSARRGSVHVEELFGVYSFKQVHQLISTIVCEKADDLSNVQVIANTFPMGSMTGAPKINALRLAEKYERSKRGVYSGAVGYFSPEGDFDFNVVIRTLLYNASGKYLTFQTGSAITIDSDPEKEYTECMLKAQAIMEVLKWRG